jgi:hypothetical protein
MGDSSADSSEKGGKGLESVMRNTENYRSLKQQRSDDVRGYLVSAVSSYHKYRGDCTINPSRYMA